MEKANGVLLAGDSTYSCSGPAAVEDRALLASTPSAAAVQWHGRHPHQGGVALLLSHAAGQKRKMPGVRRRRPRPHGSLPSQEPRGICPVSIHC